MYTYTKQPPKIKSKTQLKGVGLVGTREGFECFGVITSVVSQLDTSVPGSYPKPSTSICRYLSANQLTLKPSLPKSLT
jgi:hypothetical protein